MAGNTLAAAWETNPVGRVAAPLREQVVSALTEAILDFRLVPGQRLVERELIEQLGVSRTTVREALRQMASDGLVTVVPQRGVVVSAVTPEEARDLYDMRAALEQLVVTRFTERASDQLVEELVAAVAHFRRVASGTTDIRTVLAAKDGFYRVLLQGAASAPLAQVIESLQARVRLLRATSLSETGRSAVAVEELARITEAVRARDAPEAARLTGVHIQNAATTALAALDP